MTDATSPITEVLPSTPEARSTQSSDPDHSQNDTYSFIVHSQKSVLNGEPPEVDASKLTRKNRKRTSVEDQALLEAAYKRNPKPDKAARMEIVEQVALTEKEVQIWFQNRRQNTRRKSRPLLPHEIAAFGIGGFAAISPSTPLSTMSTKSDYTPTSATSASSQGSSQPESSSQPITQSYHESTHKLSSPDSFIKAEESTELSTHPSIDCQTTPSEASTSLLQELVACSQLPALPRPVSAGAGYLSNRRHAPAMLGYASSQTHEALAEASSMAGTPAFGAVNQLTAQSDAPSSSQVRLRLSLDGKAELVTSDSSPIRPPYQVPTNALPPPRMGSLKRSQSAVLSPSSFNPKSPSISTFPRLPTGRSRDSRTWEFCCEPDAKDELTEQAENESSGSAVAAISLLRSASNSSLKSNMNKRNAPLSSKAVTKPGKRAKIERAQSSLARLQYTHKNSAQSPGGGDSDKENWLPEDNTGNAHRRTGSAAQAQKQNRRRVLEDSSRVKAGLLTGAENATPQKRSYVAEERIYGDKPHPEIEKFMRGEVSPSKKGDLDCIQGLLSLSQGTWR